MYGSYKDLKVYERSYKAAKAVYMKISSGIPEEEKYGIKSQLKRAALSIPLNIAEGYGKGDSRKEFLRYLYMARGSVNEVLVLIEFAEDIGYIEKETARKAKEEYEEIGKMLTGLIRKTKGS